MILKPYTEREFAEQNAPLLSFHRQFSFRGGAMISMMLVGLPLIAVTGNVWSGLLPAPVGALGSWAWWRRFGEPRFIRGLCSDIFVKIEEDHFEVRASTYGGLLHAKFRFDEVRSLQMGLDRPWWKKLGESGAGNAKDLSLFVEEKSGTKVQFWYVGAVFPPREIAVLLGRINSHHSHAI